LRPGGDNTITLGDARVASFGLVGGADGKDLEEICFVFQRIEMSTKAITASDDMRP